MKHIVFFLIPMSRILMSRKVFVSKLGKKARSKHIEIRKKSNLDHVMRENDYENNEF